MTIFRKRLRMRRRDEGAILIFAIIIVTTIALVAGALLTRGDGSLRATVQLRTVAGSTYAADAAAQIAVNAIRTGYQVPGGTALDSLRPESETSAIWGYNNNEDDSGCFGQDASGAPVNTLTLPNYYTSPGKTSADTSAAVTCAPEQATGAQGTGAPINNNNKPIDAILTLGTSTSDGITFNARNNPSSRPLPIGGSVHSNSDIDIDRGYVLVDGNLGADDGCDQSNRIRVTAGNTKNCDTAPNRVDPNYASGLTSVPELRTVPSCPSGNNIATLEPGYYDDAEALNDLTDNGCNKTIWFKPGTYYFDFHNDGERDRDCDEERHCDKHDEYDGDGDGYDPMHDDDIFDARANVWAISSGRIIGGQPIDANGNLISQPSSSPTFPGTCRNPIDNINAQGVKFVFGGNSRMHVLNGSRDDRPYVELCGSYSSSAAPVVFYGLKSGAAATETSLTGSNALKASGTPSVTNFGAVTAADLANDSSPASTTYTRPSNGNSSTSTATVTVPGFATATALPKGTIITGAKLKVRHREQSNSSSASTVRFDLRAANGDAIANPETVTLSKRTSLTTDTVDLSDALSSSDWAQFKQSVHANGYSGASLLYTARPAQNSTVELDNIQLELSYYVPTLRAQTRATIPDNCLDQNSRDDCEVLETEEEYEGQLFFQGTVYAPLGAVDIETRNNGYATSGRRARSQAFLFGVISRSLQVKASFRNSRQAQQPVISVPANTAGFGFLNTTVQLTVYVCQGASTCSPTAPTARKTLVTRAKFYDPDGIPNPPNRQVSILGWSHLR